MQPSAKNIYCFCVTIMLFLCNNKLLLNDQINCFVNNAHIFVCVCVLTCSPVVKVFANDGVSTHRPVLSPHLEAALNKIKFLVTRSPAGATTNVSNSPLCHQIQQRAPQSMPPELHLSPSVAPTRNGGCWILASSLPGGVWEQYCGYF
jgi:hypothetical protein